ncbi:MAG: PfkB family carbohydrate kinase [Chloroflexota bacterium]
MHDLLAVPAVDYLLIGHLSKDLTPNGPSLGGTAAYAGLTARALGLRVGVVTSAGPDLDLGRLQDLYLECLPSPISTTFENRYTPGGREQWIHGRAVTLGCEAVPPPWRSAPIVHLAPIAAEVDPALVHCFSAGLIGLTPQGWMRAWDESGRVHPIPLDTADTLLPAAGAVVISLEDVDGDEAMIEGLADQCRLLVVTEGRGGARLYWNGDRRRMPAPQVPEVDPTGSGDIFAAAFFIRLYLTRDPWEAARFANHLASASVTRRGIDGIPRPEEIEAATVQVFR